MTSAQTAIARLKGESLQQKSLTQLKEDASDLGLSKDDVKAYGSLSYKQTWIDAINETVGKLFEDEPHGFDDEGWLIEDESNDVPPIEASFDPEPIPVFDIEDIDPEVIPYITEQAVNPSELPTLKQTDSRFKDWEPWMLPSASFVTPNGKAYKIEYLDRWGNVHAITDGMKDSSSFYINQVAQYTPSPGLQQQKDIQSTVQPIRQRYEVEDVEDGNGNTLWFIYDREECQWVCDNADDHQGYDTKEQANERLKEMCDRTTESQPQPLNALVTRFISKVIHYPRREVYRVWDTLNNAWDTEAYDTPDDAQKRANELTQISGMLAA